MKSKPSSQAQGGAGGGFASGRWPGPGDERAYDNPFAVGVGVGVGEGAAISDHGDDLRQRGFEALHADVTQSGREQSGRGVLEL